MDAVFVRDSGSLFQSDPLPKPFYCPTTPRQLSHHEQRTVLTPTHPHTTHIPHQLHWDIVYTSSTPGTSDMVLSTSGSSPFNESWPSNSVVEGSSIREGSGTSPLVGNVGGSVQDKKEAAKKEPTTESQGTLAKYIERFRSAPPTSRNTRETPSQSFWWKQSHMTSHGDHVTPPSEPRGHSTPDNQKTASYTDPSPRVSVNSSQSHLEGSLDTRSQELIDKSNSLLSAGTSNSSLPAQKYFNTQSHQTQGARKINSVPGGRQLQGTPLCSEVLLDHTDDILYQWRLKRRLELARREAAMISNESKQYKTATSSSPPVPPHSHGACHNLPCTKAETRHSYGDSGPRGSCRCAGDEPITTRASSRCACHTRDLPLLTDHSSLLETDCKQVKTCGGGRNNGVAHPVIASHSDNGQSNPLYYQPTSGVLNEQREEPEPSVQQSPSHAEPKHPEMPRDTHYEHSKMAHDTHSSHSADGEAVAPNTTPRPTSMDPSLPGCRQGLIKEDDDDDVTLSDFSLNFTTEIDQTPHTSKEGLDAMRERNIQPIVSQVVTTRLFGESLPSPQTPPHPHTITSVTPSPDPTTSKLDLATRDLQGKEASELPWDCHMDDDLLKMLITKAKLFEEQINDIDGLLSAMTHS